MGGDAEASFFNLAPKCSDAAPPAISGSVSQRFPRRTSARGPRSHDQPPVAAVGGWALRPLGSDAALLSRARGPTGEVDLAEGEDGTPRRGVDVALLRGPDSEDARRAFPQT